MKKERLVDSIPAALSVAICVACLGPGQRSDGALLMEISNNAPEGFALVSFSGSLVLTDYTGRTARGDLLLIPNPADPTDVRFNLGGEDAAGALSASYSAGSGQDQPSFVGDYRGTARFQYLDISNNGGVLFEGRIINISTYFSTSSTFAIFHEMAGDAGSFNSLIDEGDILRLSGSFLHDLRVWEGPPIDDLAGPPVAFTDRFRVGEYRGSYNGQDIMVNVIPEPSVSVLAMLAGLGLLVRRRA